MTDRTLPLLFLNLGGEMLYILEDRLKAQKVMPDKAKKVLHDIVAMMLNERFVEELFKPQELYNKQALRSLFENLAHVSIMRLNKASMNKLYDLMVMVVKYQLYSVLRPQDILQVTMNHLEALGSHPSACITRLIENYHTHFITTYASMQSGELQTVRLCILNYLQDERVRVSVLLRERLQNPDGKFIMPTSGPVPAGCEVPVIIRTFSSDGTMVTQKSYPSDGQYLPCGEAGSIGLNRKHHTLLGHNIYKSSPPSAPAAQSKDSGQGLTFSSGLLPGMPSGEASPSVGCGELSLLARLLGPTPRLGDASHLHLDLFSSPIEEQVYPQQRMLSSAGTTALMIDARSQGQTQELAAVFREMSVASGSRTSPGMTSADSSEDLLNLLDSA